MRVLVVDDNDLVRAGIVTVLQGAPEIVEIREARDGGQAIVEAAGFHPDVVLLDVRMPGVDGLAAVARLAEGARVAMISYDADAETIVTALRAGASGYLVHGTFGAAELRALVSDLAAGTTVLGAPAAAAAVHGLRESRPAAPPPWAASLLSAREREIVAFVALGRTNQEIARELLVSTKTVRNHVSSILAKLHLTSRSEVPAIWLGVRSLDEPAGPAPDGRQGPPLSRTATRRTPP